MELQLILSRINCRVQYLAIFGNFVLKSKINVNIYFTYKVVTNKWE